MPKFLVPIQQGEGNTELPAHIEAILEEATARRMQDLLDEIAVKNGQWFDIETYKLDRWAEDRRAARDSSSPCAGVSCELR